MGYGHPSYDSWLGSASGTSKNIKHTCKRFPTWCMFHWVVMVSHMFIYTFTYKITMSMYTCTYIYIYTPYEQGLMTKPFVKASNLTIKHLDLPRRARHLSIRPVHKKMSSNTIKQMLRPATLWVFHSTYMIAQWFFCVNFPVILEFPNFRGILMDMHWHHGFW